MNTMEKAIENYTGARNAAALGTEFAPDYITFKGIKLWYKTFSHAWIIPVAVSRCQKASAFEKGMLTVYVLAHGPELVRNEILQELEEGKILENAMEFFIKNNITPEDLEELDINKLMQQPYAKN